MITEFPEFHGKAERFVEPIYIKEKCARFDDIEYFYYKVIGYDETEHLDCICVSDVYAYYISYEKHTTEFFCGTSRMFYCLITEEEYNKKLDEIITKIKDF